MPPQTFAVVEITRFMVDCLTKVGTSAGNARALANHLVRADAKAHFSHGINRLEYYINDVVNKMCNPNAVPTILRETPSTAWVDGNHGLGVITGNFCMETAIKKAKDTGVGMVTAKGSNHYGMAGQYAAQALEHGLVGISMTNSSPMLTPTRASKAALGTNPIAFAAPARNGDRYILDMATTAVSVGKIEMQIRKKAPIPLGWALDSDGKPTTSGEKAYEALLLNPLGGTEENSGYKGYGLGLMVDVLCGILSGSNYGVNIRKWSESKKIADLGHFFMAFNPENFAPDFQSRMGDMIDDLRSLPQIDEDKKVLVPGDPEKSAEEHVQKVGGVTYHEGMISSLEKLADKLGVARMAPLKG